LLAENTYVIEGEIVSISSSEVEILAIELETSSLGGNESLLHSRGGGAGSEESGDGNVAAHLERPDRCRSVSKTEQLRCLKKVLPSSIMYFVKLYTKAALVRFRHGAIYSEIAPLPRLN
jgi:hypothetical protein